MNLVMDPLSRYCGIEKKRRATFLKERGKRRKGLCLGTGGGGLKFFFPFGGRGRSGG